MLCESLYLTVSTSVYRRNLRNHQIQENGESLMQEEKFIAEIIAVEKLHQP